MTTTPSPATLVTVPKTPIIQLSPTIAAKAEIPKGLADKKFNTASLSSGFLHACIYGETDARKTTTAATFASPEDTRIILTRRKEQLIPLREHGYDALLVENADELRFAMLYPEKIWPEWAGRENRTLILDDVTQAKDLLLDDNEVNDAGRELKDARQVHRGAKDDMRELVSSVLHKPMNFIMVALAQVYDNKITREEMITPDIPPAMGRMLMTEFEFVFFIDKTKYKFLTASERIVYQEKDERGQTKAHTRITFAKHKLPIALEGKGIVKPVEDLDLRKIWERVKSGKA